MKNRKESKKKSLTKVTQKEKEKKNNKSKTKVNNNNKKKSYNPLNVKSNIKIVAKNTVPKNANNDIPNENNIKQIKIEENKDITQNNENTNNENFNNENPNIENINNEKENNENINNKNINLNNNNNEKKITNPPKKKKKIKPEVKDSYASTPIISEEYLLSKKLKNKNLEISQLTNNQEKFKTELESLISKLNTTLNENAHYFTNVNTPTENIEMIQQLNYILSIRQRDYLSAKKQNKIFKEQYDLLNNKYKLNSSEKINEIEEKIEKLKIENTNTRNEITKIKSKSNVKAKVLEDYSNNKKYPLEISNYTHEIKLL